MGGPPGGGSEGPLLFPLRRRNQRAQRGKHQVTTLKGLGCESCSHVTLWSTNTQVCFAQWAGGWGLSLFSRGSAFPQKLQELGSAAPKLLLILRSPKEVRLLSGGWTSQLQSLAPVGAGQTDDMDKDNKRKGWAVPGAHQLSPGSNGGQCPGLLLFFKRGQKLHVFMCNLSNFKSLTHHSPLYKTPCRWN